MDNIISLIWDQNFQSLILSPLIGAVMGLVLTWLFTTPPDGHSIYVNIPYQQFVTTFNTTVHNHHYGTSAKEETGQSFGVLIISAWLYKTHGQTIVALCTFLAAFVFFAAALFTVKFTIERPGTGWLLRLSCAIIASAAAFRLCLWSQAILVHASYSRSLAYFGKQIPLFDAAYEAGGILFMVFALYSCTKAVLRQIALAGLTDTSDIFSARGWLIRHTERASGCIWSIGAVTFAWLIISGNLIELISALQRALVAPI